jgi:hypothetical protein
MDQRRWLCLARVQYPKTCGISSLTSCWNYLYSTLGTGTHRPISTEEALEVIGITPPYDGIKFGSFTGNEALLFWFDMLNKHFGTFGRAKISFKRCGRDTTPGINSEQGREDLEEGLRSESKAFIYHCFNHYMVPIGYEITPPMPFEAYQSLNQMSQEAKDKASHWIIIG